MHERLDEGPPTKEEIIIGLVRTGDLLTEDFGRLRSHLDRIAPVRATCAIVETPPGFAPEEIREQWVGVTLPIRSYFDPHEGIAVLAREAMEILGETSPVAHAWWRGYYSDRAAEEMPNVSSEGFPEFLANTRYLIFDFYSGGDYRLA